MGQVPLLHCVHCTLLNMFTLVVLTLTVFTVDLVSGSCQMPGNAICHLEEIPDWASVCCDDPNVICAPFDGDDSVHFCQYKDPIPVGGDCSDKKGKCEDSASCVEGVCVAAAARKRFYF